MEDFLGDLPEVSAVMVTSLSDSAEVGKVCEGLSPVSQETSEK